MVRNVTSAIMLGFVALNVASGLALPMGAEMDDTTDVLERDIDNAPEFRNIDTRDLASSSANTGLVSRKYIQLPKFLQPILKPFPDASPSSAPATETPTYTPMHVNDGLGTNHGSPGLPGSESHLH